MTANDIVKAALKEKTQRDLHRARHFESALRRLAESGTWEDPGDPQSLPHYLLPHIPDWQLRTVREDLAFALTAIEIISRYPGHPLAQELATYALNSIPTEAPDAHRP